MNRRTPLLAAAVGALVAPLALVLPAVAAPQSAAPAPAPVALPTSAPAPLPPVKKVDLERYVGTWREVASIPQIYTFQCARDTTAKYGLVDARTVSVLNTCGTWIGGSSSVKGTAKALDATGASLRVTFQGVPSFGSATTPNYVVTYLASDYSWALVGDPDRRSGFVLSRSGVLTDAQWKAVRTTVESRGYDSCRFRTTPQAGGRTDRTDLCRL